MKPNTPWSIKGIDPDARDAAKKAARAAGMTLGEWLNQQILESSQDDSDDGQDNRPARQQPSSMTASPITLDHLRELVASLNRLNDKLQRNEKNNREEIAGLNQGLTSALERIHSMEAARASNSTDALIARIERIESGGVNRQSIDGLKALEKALSRTLTQFESIREETIGRVEANETAIEGLTSRVDTIDTQFSEAIVDLRQNVDAVTIQIGTTEKSVSALMQEAREASNSNDEAFIERTSKKMRILGNEIKRTSDRIQALDSKILKLAGRIDASEQRSAEGISEISRTVSELSSELTAFDRDQGSTVTEARKVIESASSAADDRLTTLKKSFDTMLLRIEGIADGERAARQGQPPRSEASSQSVSKPMASKPAPAVSQPVMPEPQPSDDDEFDSMAAEQAALNEPEETPAEESVEDDLPPPVTDLQEEVELPEIDDELPPEVVTTPQVEIEKQDPLRTAMKGAEDAAPNEEDFDAIFGEPVARDPSDWDDDDTPELDVTPQEPDTRRPTASRPEETLTPKQKVILAARARRKRLEEQSRPVPEQKASTPQTPSKSARMMAEREQPKSESNSLIAGIAARLRGNGPETREATKEGKQDARETQAEKLRRKYSTNGDAKGGLPMIPLILAGVLAVCLLGWFLLKDSLPQNVSAIDRQPQQQAPVQPAASPTENYDNAEAAFNAGRTAEGLTLLRQSAEAGYPPAQFQLAEITRNGELGVTANPIVARELYADAAEAGNVPAMHKLGSLFASGEGGEKNDFTALTWFEQAAEYGYVDSMYNLGLLYDPEVSLEVDDQILDSAAQAYYWYSLAEMLGDPDAGEYAAETGAGLTEAERAQQDQRIANWSPQQPISSANRQFTGR